MPIINNNPDRPRQPSIADSSFIALSDRAGGFAYAAGEILVRGSSERDRASDLIGVDPEGIEPVIGADAIDRLGTPPDAVWYRMTSVDDPLSMIDRLTSEGFTAQPNHVFFAHTCATPCGRHPADAFDFVWSGASANPMRANPMRANPMRANPMRANFSLLNSAVPADAPSVGAHKLMGPGAHPKVLLLDSGLDAAATASMMVTSVTADVPDAPIQLGGALGTIAPDGFLDPVAGHGTFIAGLIEQRAPGCRIEAPKVLDALGSVKESDVIDQITQALLNYQSDLPVSNRRELIVNLSFGGSTLGEPEAMRSAVAAAISEGIVIVASAGNDGTCLPQYPAAFPGVTAVGALDSIGPAPFTNYGDWVDACAPGTDLVSRFFTFNGQFPTINTSDIDHFEGWATWSGTSFAAPIVVAAIAREIVVAARPSGRASISAHEAANRVIRAQHLMRIPCLGTVVNV